MEKILKTEQTVLPTTNIDYAESTKSNYANYMSASSTNCAGALIDIIKDVLILADPIDNSNMPKVNWEES